MTNELNSLLFSNKAATHHLELDMALGNHTLRIHSTDIFSNLLVNYL